MGRIFTKEAEFNNLLEPGQTDKQLFVSDGIHKTFIMVDEKGTEAAAATGK